MTLLMDKGGDLHNFQPSVLDITRVSDCDLFIYVGGESDGWVDDALKEAPTLLLMIFFSSVQPLVKIATHLHFTIIYVCFHNDCTRAPRGNMSAKAEGCPAHEK